MKKGAFIVCFLSVLTGVIVYLFWKEEMRYRLPTPVPKNYSAVLKGTIVKQAFIRPAKISWLHFFNPSCPCSKFNLQSVKALHKKYKNEVNFYIISEQKVEATLFEPPVTIIRDSTGQIADAYGVYSTPQAVIVDVNQNLVYRGNYNVSRFCTSASTNFAEQALQALLAGQSYSIPTVAAIAYGCNLGSDCNNNEK